MSGPARPRLAFLGLPRTGKSTFLGAMWALVQSPAETSVSETNFSGDRSYVQKLADQVARGEEIDRTDVDADEEMRVELTFDGELAADLLIPDTSGESLRVLVERRVWYPRLLAACENATAILLFVHPDRVRMPQPISAAETTGEAAERAPSAPPDDAVQFDLHEHGCTAAELIDVFENVSELCNERWPIRFGILVSAWDRVREARGPTPYEWMQAWLPGVLATVESNPDVAQLEVFGVSAQGGSLDAKDELLARGEICDRVFAQDRSGRKISLVEPIRWAIWGS
jgi:Double-GTPase 1